MMISAPGTTHAAGTTQAIASPTATATALTANALSTCGLVGSYRRNDEAGVDATEGELVADHARQLRRARLAHHVVERRAVLADHLEVAGRSDPAVAQHRDR